VLRLAVAASPDKKKGGPPPQKTYHCLIVPGSTPATRAVATSVAAQLGEHAAFAATILPEEVLASRTAVREALAATPDEVTHVVDCRYRSMRDASDIFLEAVAERFQIWCTVADAPWDDADAASWNLLSGRGFSHRVVTMSGRETYSEDVACAVLDDVLARHTEALCAAGPDPRKDFRQTWRRPNSSTSSSSRSRLETLRFYRVDDVAAEVVDTIVGPTKKRRKDEQFDAFMLRPVRAAPGFDASLEELDVAANTYGDTIPEGVLGDV